MYLLEHCAETRDRSPERPPPSLHGEHPIGVVITHLSMAIILG